MIDAACQKIIGECKQCLLFLFAHVLSDVFVGQCKSLEWLSLARSKSLKKALIEAQSLQELVIDNCLKLASLMVWSSQMTSIKGLDDSKQLEVLFLDCPTLVNFKRPVLYVS